MHMTQFGWPLTTLHINIREYYDCNSIRGTYSKEHFKTITVVAMFQSTTLSLSHTIYSSVRKYYTSHALKGDYKIIKTSIQNHVTTNSFHVKWPHATFNQKLNNTNITEVCYISWWESNNQTPNNFAIFNRMCIWNIVRITLWTSQKKYKYPARP